MTTRTTRTARRFGTNDGALCMWLAKPQTTSYKPGKHAKGHIKSNKKKRK